MNEFIKSSLKLAGIKYSGKKDVFSLVFLTRNAMSSLNRRFFGRNYATDVISFNYDKLPLHLRENDTIMEIFICPETVAHNAKIFNNGSYAKEMALCVIHGILHAAGYNDDIDENIIKMRQKEKELIGIISKKHKFSEIFD